MPALRPRVSRIRLTAHALLRHVQCVLGVDLTEHRLDYDRVRRRAYDDASFLRWLGGRGIDAPALRADIRARLVAPGGGRRTLLEARGLLWKPVVDPASNTLIPFALRRPSKDSRRQSRFRDQEFGPDFRTSEELMRRKMDWFEAT